jgi:hypothetical protein
MGHFVAIIAAIYVFEVWEQLRIIDAAPVSRWHFEPI